MLRHHPGFCLCHPWFPRWPGVLPVRLVVVPGVAVPWGGSVGSGGGWGGLRRDVARGESGGYCTVCNHSNTLRVVGCPGPGSTSAIHEPELCGCGDCFPSSGLGCDTVSVSTADEPRSVTAEEIARIEVPVDWGGAADVPTAYVNQFVVQLGPPTRGGLPDGIYLVLGNVAPPLIIGENPAAREASIRRAQGGVKPEVHGRFYLTRERLDELISSLQTIADAYDKAAENDDRHSAWVADSSFSKSARTE